MDTSVSKTDLKTAADLLRQATQALALTGAGISTPSGIPDFRSAGSGLWQRHDPMQVATLSAFRYRPERFYEWVRPLAKLILEAHPNPAHTALAELESAGLLRGVVTQNVDDLHRRAGSKKVLEIHGHVRLATCVSCYRRYPSKRLLERFAATGEVPHCEACGAILKPNIVLFEEQLPYDVVQEATEWIAGCDLLLVVGSSLEVSPASLLPVQALNAGARLILINDQPTYLDARASVLLRENVAEILPKLVAEVMHAS